MEKLLTFQKDAVKKIVEFYNSNRLNARISMSTGLGINKILIHAINEILLKNDNCKILYLCGTQSQMFQIQEELLSFSKNINVISYLPNLKSNGIFITDYRSILTYEGNIDYNLFDLIVCDNLEFLNDSHIYPFFSSQYTKKRLSIGNNKLNKNDDLIFKYSLSTAIEEGYLCTTKERNFLQNFIPDLLSYLDFENIIIENNSKDYGVDIIANYNNKVYMFEIKTYRTKHVASDLVESACNIFSVITKRQTNVVPIMIIASVVDREIKEKVLNDKEIEIWDISNLKFLCEKSQELLQKLISNIPYPIFDIKLEHPVLFKLDNKTKLKSSNKSYYKKFEDQLSNCLPGKNDKEDKKYEKICTDIIKYLFESEFFQMSTQHKTNDELFRMDMICSLKGTTEFWKFLIKFYNTKFVVFEYKNYTEKISQNLIFITSKYLFPEALRNVAFIVSRRGINKNAELVVSSKIKGEKKLIISLTDEDLLIMVAAKEKGKDPSDYLLEKVEKMLMSLSVY